ncbi:MAG: DegT/DnrJ/EryC1/StrS family aminotransferase [Muribaculaceae bacterium]|nr:DegT/DnrJ/EryC1/StrS family aminotransferase [Muribaculaceae bacterium]
MNDIKLSLPHAGGHEKKYIDEALADNWIVPLGPHVNLFEKKLGDYLDSPFIVALSAGTAAIHLALVMLGIKPGDEVICQSFTFSASANPILYQGATPVFVDSEPTTWNIDPELMRSAIIDRHAKTGRYPAAIIAVHLYGMPAQMNRIIEIAAEFGIPVVEDAAEALGSTLGGKFCGTFGRYGTLSFNGNKIITTSGGGALICPTSEDAGRVLFYATQARENRPYYYHEHVGYNYRLSNVSAAIGCGQMDVLEEHLARRRRIHDIYSEAFASHPYIRVKQNPSAEFNSNFWLTTITLSNASPVTADQLRIALAERGIETRLLWRPMHIQPVFADAAAYTNGISEDLFSRGLCLPSGSSLTDDEVNRVIIAINEICPEK